MRHPKQITKQTRKIKTKYYPETEQGQKTNQKMNNKKQLTEQSHTYTHTQYTNYGLICIANCLSL